jgi:PAS domain-containing protein
MVATQLKTKAAYWDQYASRDQTRREHQQEVVQRLGLTLFTRAHFRETVSWLIPTALQTRSGVTTGFIAIKHEVTKKRATEDKQAFLAAIVEDSKDSIIACTTSGVILAFNGAAERTFRYSANEVIGQHVSILVPADRLAALEHVTQWQAERRRRCLPGDL